MSLEALAAEMGYTHGHVSKVMRGKAKPAPRFIKKLAYATGATENELLIIAYGRPRVETARANARRIMELSSSPQDALRGLARYILMLPPDDQLTALEWFRILVNMSDSNRAKALRDITAYLEK